METRVGYAGGRSSNPTYHNLGGHTESLQLRYDPAVISFAELLQVFFEAHDAASRPWSEQYASIIFVRSDAERRTAEEALAAESARRGRPLYTAIRPLEAFYSAEAYHQKYYLRRQEKLFTALRPHFADEDAFIDATASMRANAFAGGHLDERALQSALEAEGIPPATRDIFTDEAYAPFCSF